MPLQDWTRAYFKAGLALCEAPSKPGQGQLPGLCGLCEVPWDVWWPRQPPRCQLCGWAARAVSGCSWPLTALSLVM